MRVQRSLLIAAPVVAVALIVSRPGSPAGSTADLVSTAGAIDADLPLADTPYVLGDEIDAYADFMMSGGPPPDGIPAIDDPKFVRADQAELDPGEPVIGFAHGGEARAYPHRVVVFHEIVNDEVAGLPVSVTYCPLTATALGFKRADTTLGVSGQLLNSNLVMYDRDSESYFAQIAATGITGEHRGRTLEEVDVTWTTWGRWRAAHPETLVLSDDTGYLRNYGRDPYGSYDPTSGYYERDGTIFPLMHDSDRHHSKAMVVGGRTENGSVYFVLDDLAREGVQATDHFVAVYDPSLHTGRIYAIEGGPPEISEAGDGRYAIDGETYAAEELPLESVIPIEAFFFAWHAFYPDSETP